MKATAIPISLLSCQSLKNLEIGYNPFNLEQMMEFKAQRDKLRPDLSVDIFDDERIRNSNILDNRKYKRHKMRELKIIKKSK